METEQWLEEAMFMTNKSLRLIPDVYLRKSIKSCREQGISLESVASAGSLMGLIDEERISELKERIPEPSNTRPRPKDLRAVRKTHQACSPSTIYPSISCITQALLSNSALPSRTCRVIWRTHCGSTG